MNFDYSEEEYAFADQARRLLADKAPLSLVRALLEGEGASQADALWSEVSALGWPAVAISEKYGGLGFGHVALCALAEEIGRALAPLPMLPSMYLAAEALSLAGTEDQKERWLPSLASGEVIGTALVDTNSVTLTAKGGMLYGTVMPVAYGDVAGVAIIAARQDKSEECDLYVVDMMTVGLKAERLKTIDDSLPHALLHFEGVSAEFLGGKKNGSMVDSILLRAAVLISFEQLGGADACLEMAKSYVQERQTFGRVIGSYQAIKHRLADMYAANELARSNAYYGAWALASDAPELALAAATARVSSTEAYEFAASENIQLHGGIGFTWEADCQLHYRRSRMLAQIVQPVAYWHDRLCQALDETGEENGL